MEARAPRTAGIVTGARMSDQTQMSLSDSQMERSDVHIRRVADWRNDWPEPDVQRCRGCGVETTARADAVVPPDIWVWVPMCFRCWTEAAMTQLRKSDTE